MEENLFFQFTASYAAPFQPISSKSATSSSLSAPLTSVATSTPPTRSAPPNDEYLKQLCSLNTSVTQWISEHVDKNPYVDLTPIFKDYETHLSNIDKKVGALYLPLLCAVRSLDRIFYALIWHSFENRRANSS